MGILDNKISIVTGGSSGIGLATAQAFHREGAQVIITARDEKKLIAEGKSIAEDVLTIQSDTSSLDDIETMLARTQSHFNKIDVLFLNVGADTPIAFEQVTENIFDEVINTNLKGAFFTI